jgi:AcrR family transcriptional regulator
MNGIDLIYKTAGKLFADKGFGSVSMGEIAEKCKMSKANLYHHFSSKNDLYEKIILRALQNISDILAKTEQIEGTYVNKIKFPAVLYIRSMPFIFNPY